MTTSSKVMTLDEFRAFAQAPENSDLNFELINGEIIPLSPGRTLHSYIKDLIVAAVHAYCREKGLPRYTSSADGAYLIGGHVIAPDFAYKTTPMIDECPDPVQPMLAVEIISPTDKPKDIRSKRAIYQEAGILYWEAYPTEKLIDVYEPGKPPRALGIHDALDGGTVIPGFTLPLKELFAE